MRRGARAAMLRRTRGLAVVEAANAVWLPLVFLLVGGVPPSPANLVGLGLVAAFLIEGAVFWALKHRQLRHRRARPRGLAVFRALRVVNAVALVAGLVPIGLALLDQPGARSWPGLAFWVFAAAEHVNYFHRQLMHDTRDDLARLARRRRLRPSPLARDLRR